MNLCRGLGPSSLVRPLWGFHSAVPARISDRLAFEAKGSDLYNRVWNSDCPTAASKPCLGLVTVRSRGNHGEWPGTVCGHMTATTEGTEATSYPSTYVGGAQPPFALVDPCAQLKWYRRVLTAGYLAAEVELSCPIHYP